MRLLEPRRVDGIEMGRDQMDQQEVHKVYENETI